LSPENRATYARQAENAHLGLKQRKTLPSRGKHTERHERTGVSETNKKDTMTPRSVLEDPPYSIEKGLRKNKRSMDFERRRMALILLGKGGWEG